jgi:chromosome segregation ATPase
LKIIAQKNKIIGELEAENESLQEENARLNENIERTRGSIETYTLEMQKTTREYLEIKEVLKRNDAEMRAIRQENDQMRFQMENFREQIDKKSISDSTVIDKYVKEYEMKLANKDDDIRKLTELVIELRENFDKQQIDSDKTTVTSLTKVWFFVLWLVLLFQI